MVENNAKIKIGESVVVFGSGGIGLNIIQAAAMVSAYPIIAVDIFEDRLELSKSLGATHVINSKTNDPESEIMKILGNQKLNVFIDNTGNTGIIELGYKLVHSDGRVILVGVPRIGSDVRLYTLPLHFGKTLIGSHGGESNPSNDIPRYLNLVSKGRLEFKNIISSRYKLKDINDAILAMKSGKTAGRVLIKL